MKITMILAVLMAATPLFAENTVTVESDEAKVIAVRMYADWCGYCKQLDPKVDAIKPDFEGKPVLFLQVDQTNDFAKEQSAMLTGLTGLDNVLSPYAGRTGLLLVIDTSSGNIIHEMDHTASSEEIKKAIEKLL